MMPPGRYRSRYVVALHRHVLRGDETTLREGYELGRAAVAESVSVLDLAAVHHDALLSALEAAQPDHAAEVVTAAAAFFQEILSAFEMIHRGYREAAAAAASERHHAAMLRRLSSFLADVSLSARQADASTEVLHLVVEHARELTDSAHATASWRDGDEQVRVTSSDPDANETLNSDVLAHLERVAPALPRRVSSASWSEQPTLRRLQARLSVLTVGIAALDGRRVGCLQMVDKRTGEFTDADEATAVHLADMTAAALERAELYRGRYASL